LKKGGREDLKVAKNSNCDRRQYILSESGFSGLKDSQDDVRFNPANPKILSILIQTNKKD